MSATTQLQKLIPLNPQRHQNLYTTLSLIQTTTDLGVRISYPEINPGTTGLPYPNKNPCVVEPLSSEFFYPDKNSFTAGPLGVELLCLLNYRFI